MWAAIRDRTEDRPTAIHTGERRRRGSGEDDRKGIHGQEVCTPMFIPAIIATAR